MYVYKHIAVMQVMEAVVVVVFVVVALVVVVIVEVTAAWEIGMYGWVKVGEYAFKFIN